MSGLECCECGGARSYGSALRCRACYRRNAAIKREGTPVSQILATLLDMERRGVTKCVRGGWTLTPYHLKHPGARA